MWQQLLMGCAKVYSTMINLVFFVNHDQLWNVMEQTDKVVTFVSLSRAFHTKLSFCPFVLNCPFLMSQVSRLITLQFFKAIEVNLL